MTESLLSVVNTLDTYYTVLVAELEQIDADMDVIHTFIKRYWEASLHKLTRTKRQKENMLRDVKLQIELFNIHLESGRELCNRLERVHPIIVRPREEDLNEEQTTTQGGKKSSGQNLPRKILSDGSVQIGNNIREISIASSILAYSNGIEMTGGDSDSDLENSGGKKQRVNVPLASITARQNPLTAVQPAKGNNLNSSNNTTPGSTTGPPELNTSNVSAILGSAQPLASKDLGLNNRKKKKKIQPPLKKDIFKEGSFTPTTASSSETDDDFGL
ncbi:predicted protein [Naegleria gruberi]|uniref:Predicted protein n=1 Tax=Naegleria gruberi TaxID=5762 RepID=D2W0W3_NAEGR|nr:uncharacterized protein NAEGRDRAFT_75002 [Naegleria gruberi]EFC37250.1 predicted protein [Naegleria gruberi]|eukprot:XP_002669994.1 predicted protein [Naegleria gruberi strain NEG-M]